MVILFSVSAVFSLLSIVLLCIDLPSHPTADMIFTGIFILLFAFLFVQCVLSILKNDKRKEAELDLMLQYYTAEQDVRYMVQAEICELDKEYAKTPKDMATISRLSNDFFDILDQIQIKS